MPRLHSLRYVNIGYPTARCDDLWFPLTDTQGQPTDTTFWLRNGGGKSQTIILFFSLIRPTKREFLGQMADGTIRKLADYILKGDRSVVAAEWELDGGGGLLQGVLAGPRLITGVFYERRDGRPVDAALASEEDKIEKLFFAMRVTPGAAETEIRALPLFLDAAQTQRRSLAGFRRALEELRSRVPQAQVTWVQNNFAEWAEVLQGNGIDPELFQYQLRMNEKEGGADRLFADCTRVQDFVNLFLEILVDRRLGQSIRENLERHREQLLRRQTDLVPGLGLVRALRPPMTRLAAVAVERAVVAQQGSAVRAGIESALAAADFRAAELTAEQTRHATEQKSYEAQAAEHRNRAGTLAQQAVARRRDALALRWRLAHGEVEEQKRVARELRTLRDQWECAVKLRDALQQEATAERHLQQQEDLEREHAPLRAEVVAAGNRLAGALLAEQDRLLALAEEAEGRATEAERMRQDAQQDIVVAVSEAVHQRAEAQQQRAAEQRASQERETLRKAGALGEHETPADAQRSLALQLQDAQTAVLHAERQLSEALSARNEANTRREALRSAVREAAEELQSTTRELQEAERVGRPLATDPRLLALLELEAVGHDVLDHDAAALVRTAAADAVEQLLLLRETQAADARAVAALVQTELLPPSPDVTRVLAAIGPAALGAYAGWAYLADTCTPAAARQVITTAPDVALGVVVRDSDYDAAVRALQASPPLLDGAVRVVTQSYVAALVEGVTLPADGWFTAMPSSDAHFDRSAGRAERSRREQHFATLDRELRTVEGERSALEGLAARLTSYLERFGSTWFAERRAAHAAATQALTAAREEEGIAVAAVERTTSAWEAAREALDGARTEVERIDRLVQRLDQYLERHGVDLARYTSRAEAADRAALDADTRRMEASERSSAADVHAQNAREEKSRFVSDAAVIAAEAARITYREPDASIARVPGNRVLLLQEYQSREATYEGKVQAKDLGRLVEMARQEAARHRGAFQKKTRWPEETIRALIDSLPSWDEVDQRQEDSKQRADSAQGKEGNLAAVAARLLAEADQTVEECLKLGVLSAKAAEHAETLPSDADEALWQTWLADAQAAQVASQTAHSEADTAAGLAQISETDAQRVRGDLATLKAGLGTLRTAVDQSAAFLSTFPVSPAARGDLAPLATDAAFLAAVPEFEQALKSVRGAVEQLNGRAGVEVQEVRSVLVNPDFAHLREALFTRMREAEPLVLEHHAGELAQQIESREAHLVGAIADLDQHRDQLVELVLLAAEEGRRLLRQVGTRSMIPTKVPNRLGGQQFLKVTGADPSPDAALDRRTAGMLVDGWVQEKAIPKPLDLIQGAVQALAPKLRMQILHPDGQRTPKMHPIEELGAWSGGEKLTAATLLYCTLARVRAVNRGETGDATGVLICDNPQGTASRVSFLLTQREVARALGVQLIYFTGINDLEAVRIMPNVIKVKNDAVDRRTGQQVLQIADLTDGEGAPEPTLEAVRLVRDETRHPAAPLPTRLDVRHGSGAGKGEGMEEPDYAVREGAVLLENPERGSSTHGAELALEEG